MRLLLPCYSGCVFDDCFLPNSLVNGNRSLMSVIASSGMLPKSNKREIINIVIENNVNSKLKVKYNNKPKNTYFQTTPIHYN